MGRDKERWGGTKRERERGEWGSGGAGVRIQERRGQMGGTEGQKDGGEGVGKEGDIERKGRTEEESLFISKIPLFWFTFSMRERP